MEKLTKAFIINSAKNRFYEIPKIIQIIKFDVKIGWLEVHYCNSDKYTLNEFIISSLRYVKFWEYREDDQSEFENDISNGKFISIKKDDAIIKIQLLKNMFSEELLNIDNELIPIDLNKLNQYKAIYLIYDEWNNIGLTLVSDTQFKNIFFGHSE